ncbi:thermonuclease family protein [Thalassobius aquimarinus]|uniref:Thermonuclease family protein n=2 Tax=Thalassovita aquimarina TaxID=2785917 RepID=A0ABS5HSK0_9RHOB|nr:thermonuclease family protein [Thalassovita aquimarina]
MRPSNLALIVVALILGAVLFREGLIPGSSGADVTGPVTHVRDGDTIELRGVAIRLNGLNCDERGTRLGEAATVALRDLVQGQELTCRLNGDKTYDREVGRCALPDGRDIGAELIRAGLCGRCDRYDPQGTYVNVQREAGPFAGSFPDYCRR